MISPKARVGDAVRPTRSRSQFVSLGDRPVGSNKAVTQIARDAKSTLFVTGRRVTAGGRDRKERWRVSVNGVTPRGETDRSVGDGLGRLDAGSLTAILAATR